jgi:hypothetical protein
MHQKEVFLEQQIIEWNRRSNNPSNSAEGQSPLLGVTPQLS